MQRPKLSLSKLIQAAGLAAVVATAVNLSLFAIGRATGAISTAVEVMPGMGPLEWSNVALLSFLPPFVAALLLFVLARFVPRPLPAFYTVAVVVFVLFGAGPLAMEGASAAQVWLMMLMHAVVAVPVVWALTRATRAAAELAPRGPGGASPITPT